MTKVLITGAAGQLGNELRLTAPDDFDCLFFTRQDLDITSLDQTKTVINELKPDVVINAAAYTAVDKAEEQRDLAFKINASGPENLARALPDSAYLLHVSTDFVFSGDENRPYSVDAKTAPKSVYGESKLAGERAIANVRAINWSIIRTSWVYSTHGNNFVKTMLRFMDQRDELGIVVDQVGSPTWAKNLAEVCWSVARHKISGVYHWSDAGAISWFDFAHEIQRIGKELGLITKGATLNAIPTEGYPLPAARPAYSVLDKSKILAELQNTENKHWQHNLMAMMRELKATH